MVRGSTTWPLCAGGFVCICCAGIEEMLGPSPSFSVSPPVLDCVLPDGAVAELAGPFV